MIPPQSETPPITPLLVKEVISRNAAIWHNRIKAGEPRLGFESVTHLRKWSSSIRTASDRETVRRREALRRRVIWLLETRWLTHYLDADEEMRATLQPRLGFPVPEYLPWQELLSYGILPANAREELWQRDVGDAIVAFAMAALLYDDIADICRQRMKEFVLATLDFRTWGDQGAFTNMDLSVDHIARGIAIALDWRPDDWTAGEYKRIVEGLRGKLSTLLKGAYGHAFWARGYTDNHCHNAIATLGICGTKFLGVLPEAEEWLGAALAGFEFVARDCNPDGSSAEGIPYWSYGMSFMCQYIELTRRISGADWLYGAPYFQNASTFRLHASLSNLSGTAPFGDAPKQDYYGPSHILYAFARQNRDTTAQWLGDTIPFADHGGPDVAAWSLLWRDPALPPAQPSDIPRDKHLPCWDVAFTRSGWGDADYAVAIKSGYTNRNHSHLDAGTILFGWGDEWLIEAPGYGKVGDGFWDARGQRWTFYSNSTESHSTLLIDGKNQRFGKLDRATIDGFETTPDTCWVSVDLSEAYDEVVKVRRQVLHRRNRYVLVLDEVELQDTGRQSAIEWLLQPGRTTAVDNGSAGVTIAGKCGSITVCSLAAPAAFQRREPKAPHVDIPPDAIQTLALHAQGTSAGFAVLIVPAPAGALAPVDVQGSILNWAPGDRQVCVSGDGFEDVLTSAAAGFSQFEA
ncbi:MAG: heparinase II/III family protein [Capsulimonadaceae bacterium]|nr:heparinase II/III family protein [Capsulimonadaceae bacterium]